MKGRITRRDFVKASAAVAAPVIVPATVFGTQEKAAPANRITVGVIGVGTMGRYHLDRCTENNELQVVAICDVDTTRRESAKKTAEERGHKSCAAYVDYRELLARKDIQAVFIATPDHWHTLIAIEAVQAGKDVYCEKPLTLTLHEGKVLIDVVRKHDRVFQVGSQQRSDKEFWTACSLVRSGRIGKVVKVTVGVGNSSKWCDLPAEDSEPGLDWERWLGQAPMRPYNSVLAPRGVHKHFPKWREYREYSGGYYTDWGAHHYDIAQWGLGMDESGPVEIVPPEDPKAFTGCKYVYANGVEMFHGGPGGVTFVGTGGEIHVDRGKLSSKPEGIVKEPLGDGDVKLYRSPGHHKDWLACIKERRRPICDVEVGARSVAVCHLGNLAYWNRRKLTWDPKEWKFTGDEEANGWRDRERRGPYQLPKV